MTTTSLFARSREGGSGSGSHKRAKNVPLWLTKRELGGRMAVKTVPPTPVAAPRSWAGKDQKTVQTL